MDRDAPRIKPDLGEIVVIHGRLRTLIVLIQVALDTSRFAPPDSCPVAVASRNTACGMWISPKRR